MPVETTENEDLAKVLKLLGRVGYSDEEFLRDALWLAQFMPQVSARDPEPATTVPPRESDAAQAEKKEKDKTGQGATEKQPAPAPRDPAQDTTESGRLYPKVEEPKGSNRKATAVYVPASGALPQPLELARALRPFQRKFRSRRAMRLDISATVELTADRGQLTPVLAAERERWFSVSLLVDDAPSMAVWRKTAAELAQFLERLGIFRDVRSWSLDENLRLTAGGGQEATWKQLIDPSGRTLIVVITNGVGRHWQSREMAQWLSDWARTGPVSICSLLPPIRWQHTDVGPAYLWARAPVPGAGNRLLTAGEGPRTITLKPGATLFPIFPLTKEGFENWSAMEMSRRETRLSAVQVLPAWFEPHADIAPRPPSQGIAERVAQFRSFASRDAAELLQYFSAIPLSLPVMRLVQHTMMPESPLSAMAEVLMSGLVAPSPKAPAGSDPELALFEFSEEARAYLRDRTSVHELETIHNQVKEKLQEYIRIRAGISVTDFETFVEDPAGLRTLPADVQHFAQVTAETLRALGYRSRKRSEPSEIPGFYIAWYAPEMEDFSKSIAEGLSGRGLRVLMQGRDVCPKRGWIVMVSNNADTQRLQVTDELARALESGLDGKGVVAPGVTPKDDGLVYADRYQNFSELLDAVISEIGKLDPVPVAPPIGGPPLERGQDIMIEGDEMDHLDGLLGHQIVTLFSNDAYAPRRSLNHLTWLYPTRRKFPGGIRWVNGEVNDSPGQLLIYDRPSEKLRIPPGCSAVVIDPEPESVIELPDGVKVYEGDPKSLQSLVAAAELDLKDILPQNILQSIHNSPHLLKFAKQMVEHELWGRVRSRIGAKWISAAEDSAIELQKQLVKAAFQALEPPLDEAAGVAGALQIGASRELIEKLLSEPHRRELEKLDLFDTALNHGTEICCKLAVWSPGWRRWNQIVLDTASDLHGGTFEDMGRNDYLRQHLVFHLVQVQNWKTLERVLSNFNWWALKIEMDGWASLLRDFRLLPADYGFFDQIRNFVEWLKDPSQLDREGLSQAISRYDLPLPDGLRKSAGAARQVEERPEPERFILLAGSRRTSNTQIEGEVSRAAQAIATVAALRGFGLICGAEFGSDAMAVQAFCAQKKTMGEKAASALRIVTYHNDPVPFDIPSGTTVVLSSDQITESVAMSDAVVLLGGNQFVRRVAHAASAAGKRVFPIPGTGGAAESLFEELAKADSRLRRAPWAADIPTAGSATSLAVALFNEIARPLNDASTQQSRLTELSACRSAELPPFIVEALGVNPVDAILEKDGLIIRHNAGGVTVEAAAHAAHHARASVETHLKIAAAMDAEPSAPLSLRERVFHWAAGGNRDRALAVARDVAWLIPAAELAEASVLGDLESLGLNDLASALFVQGKTVRERLAESRDLEIARAAIRYERAQIYIQVAGTGLHELDPISQSAAEAMGLALARAGFGLITGGWSGVDYVTTATYLNSGGKSLIQALTPASNERFKEALVVNGWSDPAIAQKLSDGVVLIGGVGGTMEVYESARALGKPVFPYGPSGGDAKTVAMNTNDLVVRSQLSPEEFAAYTVSRLLPGKNTSLAEMWNLAAEYEEIRATMSSGAQRTHRMTEIYEKMLSLAPNCADHLGDLGSSPSAGRRLAAISILHTQPRRELLGWLAERLDNPVTESPFVGFQAAAALREAARHLSPAGFGQLYEAFDDASTRAMTLTTDPGRLFKLAEGELELVARSSSRPQELEVTRLVNDYLQQRGYSEAVVTRNLLIFRTQRQSTWLTFTTAGPLFSLDNRPRGDGNFRVQWFQRLQEVGLDSVVANDSDNRHSIALGSSSNWYFSTQLFRGSELVATIRTELRRAARLKQRSELALA